MVGITLLAALLPSLLLRKRPLASRRRHLAPDGLRVRRNRIGLSGQIAGRIGGGNRESLFSAATDTRRGVCLSARQGPNFQISVERGDELLKG